jgi:membrane protease YdiL (CAAX protease family)
VVYVRKGGEDAAHVCEPKELAAEGGSFTVTADTLISTAREGPFAPLPVSLERDAGLRDLLARAIPVPSLTAWSRLRLVVLGLATAPFLMLLELDCELVTKDLLGRGRLIVDLLLAAYVGFELTRKTPRLPAVAVAALLAVSMRWLLVVTRLCGKHVHAAVWVAAALSLGAAAILTRAPTRARLSLELLGKLGISRSDALVAKRPEPVSRALVAASTIAAAGLPFLSWALKKNAASVWPQAIAIVVYALAAPEIVRRVVARTDGRGEAPPRNGVVKTVLAIAVGLSLTAALLHGTHHFFDAGGELARCTGRLDEASRRLLGAEAAELSRRIASVRASTGLVVMTTCVMPLAEERIYRGVLMNVLVRRYGLTYGLFVSAAAFGLSHVGIYEIALYQTILLGIGFGIAYAEGGIVAAFVVHAVWNLLNIA